MMPWDVDIPACRGRQRRLLDEMHRLDVELVIITQIDPIQWLAGPRFEWKFSPVAALAADGRLTLVAPTHKGRPVQVTAAADEVLPYEAQWLSTLRNDQRAASSAVLLRWLADRTKPRRLGVEASSLGASLSLPLAGAELVDVEPTLYQLRRRKDPDELARIKKAIAGTAAMFKLARDIVRPGINELDVFAQLQGAAVLEFGEPMTGTGNDYQSGSAGGPPRNRAAEEGELYILDLGPAFRGYFADVTRTLAVGGRPTDLQYQAWEQTAKVFPLIARTVRPGKKCRELFDEASALLAESSIGKFDHHLGHGIGLYPHEAPHLNPNWDDTFEEGDVFAAEPGLYSPKLRAGLRLENNYRVTDRGVELLSDFPLAL
jgi:Xaa-Pro dipeptidase